MRVLGPGDDLPMWSAVVYPLFPVSEKAHLDVNFALRLAPHGRREAAGLATRPELQRLGYSPRQIQALTPMAELYNPVGHFWYPVYQVPRRDLTYSWYTYSVFHREVLPCVSF